MLIQQYNIKIAYLNGIFEKKVYMEVLSLMDEILSRIIKDESSDHRIIAETRTMLYHADKLATGDEVC